jgi:hypothetical protein
VLEYGLTRNVFGAEKSEVNEYFRDVRSIIRLSSTVSVRKSGSWTYS